jgi:hypothetical protein
MRGMCRLGPSAVCINFSLAVVIKPAWCSGLFISSCLSLQLFRLPASAGRTSGIGLAEPWWLTAVIRRHKAVALILSEEFDFSGRHKCSILAKSGRMSQKQYHH